MLNQFSRTQLLLGQDGMERLYNARVAVFGIGGVGGYTVEALVRSGVGTLDLIDDDRVCLTNVNRQIFATRKTVGQYKVDVAEERIKEINPNAVVHTYKTFYARFQELFPETNLISLLTKYGGDAGDIFETLQDQYDAHEQEPLVGLLGIKAANIDAFARCH